MSARTFENFFRSLDETQLEQWVLAYINSTYQTDKRAQRIGRRGQAQKGVDVHAVVRDIGDVGYQAKAYVSTKLTVDNLKAELEEAHTFNPPLKQYTVVTLNPRDAALQEHAREATIHGEKQVTVLALEDLVDIANGNPALRKALLDMVISAEDVGYLVSTFAVDAASVPVNVLSIEADNALPSSLQSVEEWINAGMPRKALTALGEFTGTVSESSRARLECRAHFALGEYSTVLEIVEREQARPDVNASVLALGAHAADELEDSDLADELLALALVCSNERNKPDAVAAHVRIKADREGTKLELLEKFSAASLDDPGRIASALGDAAARLGEQARALYWFAQARQKKPNLALGILINEACTATSIALGQLEAGFRDETGLDEEIRTLESLETRTRSCEVSAYRIAVLNALAVVYQSVSRYDGAAQTWDQALSLTDGPELNLWTRRCILSANEQVQPPQEEAISKHAVSGMARLALASAFINAGRAEDARSLIQSTLDDAQAPEDEKSIAVVEMLRLRRNSGELNKSEALDAALLQLEITPNSVPLVSWVVIHHHDASEAQRRHIRAHIETFPIADLEDERLLVFAGAMLQGELGDVVVSWFPRIESIAFDESGEICHHQAADLVGELYLSVLRYEDAIRVRKQLLNKYPSEPPAVQMYARTLYEAGDREGAYQALKNAIEVGVKSSRMILNMAQLALVLGHRREAHRILQATHIEETTSPDDYVRLLQAQAILGVKGHHSKILSGLREGLITAENAGAVFGLGLRRRYARNSAIEFGSVFELHIPDVIDGTVCIVEEPAKPLPGIRTFDAKNHPWVFDLVGSHSGDTVEITQGTFAGKSSKIGAVYAAADWLVHQARDLIAISPPERTGVQQFVGDADHHIAVTKKQLEVRRDSIAKSMEIATANHMPISALSQQFATSPREFFRSDRGWAPTAHTGTVEEIAIDDAALSAPNARYLFDPVTLLLLFAIGAESLLSALPHKPRITKQAAWQLVDWYWAEREGRRATAHLGLSDDGKLIWNE